MTELRHAEVDVFKLDIEWGEYKLLPAMLAGERLPNILLVEVRLATGRGARVRQGWCAPDVGTLMRARAARGRQFHTDRDPDRLVDIINVFLQLDAAGYRCYYKEPNTIGDARFFVEYAFVRT